MAPSSKVFNNGKTIHIAYRKNANSELAIIVQNFPLGLITTFSSRLAALQASKPMRTQFTITGSTPDGIKLVLQWLRKYNDGIADISIEVLGTYHLTAAYRMLDAAQELDIMAIVPYHNALIATLSQQIPSADDLTQLLREFNTVPSACNIAVLATSKAIVNNHIPANSLLLREIRNSYQHFSTQLDVMLKQMQEAKAKRYEEIKEKILQEQADAAAKARAHQARVKAANIAYHKAQANARRVADQKRRADRKAQKRRADRKAQKDADDARKVEEAKARKAAEAEERDARHKKALYDTSKPYSSSLFPVKRGAEETKDTNAMKKADGVDKSEKNQTKPQIFTFINEKGQTNVVKT